MIVKVYATTYYFGGQSLTKYAQGILPKDPTLPGSVDLQTDGFSTLKKVRNMPADVRLLVIRGKKDKLMTRPFMAGM
jgi:hypothetical protein